MSSDNQRVNRPPEPPARPVSAPPVAAASAPPVTHYENFPVASLLCPPHLRPAIAALYAFARTADDIADEGTATADERLNDLQSLASELQALASGRSPSARWSGILLPLQAAIETYDLPTALLQDLLSAFAQDVRQTRDGLGYADREALVDYCRRSANPVGRLLLHLYRVSDPQALEQSDAICTALQLANFWQDLSVDIPRGRYYLPAADCAQHGALPADVLAQRRTPETTRLLQHCVDWTRALMLSGAPLVHQLPGRAGWELRLVVQGGLRILEKVEALQGNSLCERPRLHAGDWCRMLLRAVRM